VPNWVYNSLTVTGSPDEVEAARKQVGSSYTRDYIRTEWDEGAKEWSPKIITETTNDPEFSFWNIVRPSDDILPEYLSVHRDDSKRSGWIPDGEWSVLLNEPATGDLSNHWYDWNIRNWGVKWDAADVEFEQYEDGDLHYRFSTAWSIPHEAMLALSAQFINCKFYLEYEEEQGWGGENEYIAGDYTNLQEWGIPDSHEDNTLRDRPCVCEWEPDDPEYWYDDCPREVVAA
jgi:hypothetical protein